MERINGTTSSVSSVSYSGLSERELGNLLASVGNHEAKALILGVMNPGVIYKGTTLRRAMLERQGRTIGWDFNDKLPVHYLRESLEPIGLVAAEVTDAENNRYGFVKTQYGENIGDALSGHLLDFSLGDPNISLIDYFGSTTSSFASEGGSDNQKKRAPLTRYRIFWDLITRQLPARQVDIADALGEKVTYLSDHIEVFASRGIITYEARVADKRFARFYVPGQFSSYSAEQATWGWRVFESVTDALKKYIGQEVDINGVAADIAATRPDIPEDKVDRLVGRALADLVEEKAIERRAFNRFSQSSISLTEAQRLRLVTLVELLDDFTTLDLNFLQEGREKMQRILAQPEDIYFLLAKARRASPRGLGNSREELRSWVEEAVAILGLSTTKEIQEYLGQQHGKRVVPTTINRVMMKLIEDQRVIISSAGTSYTYAIKE